MELGKKITSILKVLVLAYVVTAVLLLLGAFIMYKAGIGESRMRIFVMVIYGIVTIISGFVYGRIRGGRRLLNGCLIGLIYFAVLMVISLIVNHGSCQDLKKAAISMTVCIVGGAIGGVMS